MRERLIELVHNVPLGFNIADYLLENGVVVLTKDSNEFNTDLYCPYCGNNLTNWHNTEIKK